MRKLYFLPILIAVAGLSLGAPANAGKDDLVGTKIVNDMRIEFYMESPKHGMVMTSGKPMVMRGAMKMVAAPTHHPEVKVLDAKSGRFIPYLDVVLRFERVPKGDTFNIPLPPMLGGWFHYGRNATLPGKGKYRVTVEVIPQELMRYKRMAKKWASPARVTFDYNW